MTCVPAPTCKAALNEATRLAPTRRKDSDGICASAQHTQQNPNSDHETGDAFDLTDDKPNGCDVDVLFARIIARRDPRVKYLIRNRRILRSYAKSGTRSDGTPYDVQAWEWDTYTGSNPHIKHGHCSIYAQYRNDTSPWFTAAQEEDDMPLTNEDKQWIKDTVYGIVTAQIDAQVEALLVKHQQQASGGSVAADEVVAAIKKQWAK